MVEFHLDGVRVEDDIAHDVLALVTPVSDDAAINELIPATLFKFVPLNAVIAANIANPLKTAVGRHELEDRVNDEGGTNLTLEDRGLEARHNLQLAVL